MKENWLKPGQLVLPLSADDGEGARGVEDWQSHTSGDRSTMATAAFTAAFFLPVAEHCGLFGVWGLHSGPQPREVLQALGSPWCHGKGQVLLPGCDNPGVLGVLVELMAQASPSCHLPVPLSCAGSCGTKALQSPAPHRSSSVSPYLDLLCAISKSPLLSCWLFLPGAGSPQHVSCGFTVLSWSAA